MGLLGVEEYWPGNVSEKVEAPITPELKAEVEAYCRKTAGMKPAKFARLCIKFTLLSLIKDKKYVPIHLTKAELEDLLLDL